MFDVTTIFSENLNSVVSIVGYHDIVRVIALSTVRQYEFEIWPFPVPCWPNINKNLPS